MVCWFVYYYSIQHYLLQLFFVAVEYQYYQLSELVVSKQICTVHMILLQIRRWYKVAHLCLHWLVDLFASSFCLVMLHCWLYYTYNVVIVYYFSSFPPLPKYKAEYIAPRFIHGQTAATRPLPIKERQTLYWWYSWYITNSWLPMHTNHKGQLVDRVGCRQRQQARIFILVCVCHNCILGRGEPADIIQDYTRRIMSDVKSSKSTRAHRLAVTYSSASKSAK